MRANSGNAEPQLGAAKQHAKLGLGVPRDGAPGPKGWYSRWYLPHYDAFQTIQAITFRLADSLPQERLERLERELALVPRSSQDLERRIKIEQWLDSGMGCCALRHPQVAMMTQETFLKFSGERYRLIAWCVMPNHVHVLIEPNAPLAKIVQSWKSYTGRWAMARNTCGCGNTGIVSSVTGITSGKW